MTARIFASPGATSHQGGRRRGGKKAKDEERFLPFLIQGKHICGRCDAQAPLYLQLLRNDLFSQSVSARVEGASTSATIRIIFIFLFKTRIIIDQHLLCFVRIIVLHTQSSLSALLLCQRGLFLRPGVIYRSSSNHFKSM